MKKLITMAGLATLLMSPAYAWTGSMDDMNTMTANQTGSPVRLVNSYEGDWRGWSEMPAKWTMYGGTYGTAYLKVSNGECSALCKTSTPKKYVSPMPAPKAQTYTPPPKIIKPMVKPVVKKITPTRTIVKKEIVYQCGPNCGYSSVSMPGVKTTTKDD